MAFIRIRSISCTGWRALCSSPKTLPVSAALVSEITPLLIVIKLEQFDYAGATAIALVFLIFSFTLLLLINFLTWRRSRRVLATEGDS
mgnify:CR=1 FL=1